MICKVHWKCLDDCNQGILEHQVIWDGCSLSHKRELMREYNMMEYQPQEKSKPEYWYNNYDSIYTWVTYPFGFIVYPLLAYFVFYPLLVANSVPFVHAMFILAVGIFPAIFATALIGLFLTLLVNVIAQSLHGIVLRKRKKKQSREDEFFNFIKGCRDGSN